MKIDKAVRRETCYIALMVAVMSVLMQAVFLVLRKWSAPVLFGNLLSACVAILNFFLMGLTVQKAVTKEEKQAKNLMTLSQTLRTIMLFLAAVLGASLACFNIITVIVPLFFPRIAIALRPVFGKRIESAENAETEDRDGE